MRLYEYAVILDEERDKHDKVVEKAELLDRGEFLAADESQAQILAARRIPEERLEQLERITLAVRPF